MVFGDSLSAAYGIARSRGWVALLAQRLKREHPDYIVVNASISGDTSGGGLARIQKTLQQHRPSILILELGANDGLRGLAVAALRDNLETIIRRTRERHPDAAIVLVGMEAPPNLGETYTTEFREVYEELARRHDLALVPFLLDGVAGMPEYNLDDGIHPSDAGHRRIARNLWPVLEPVLHERAARHAEATR